MNHERMMALAKAIEDGINDPDTGNEIMLNMVTFQKKNCDTVACAGGHACAMWAPDVWRLGDVDDIETAARRELDLTEPQADWLFYGRFKEGARFNLESISKEEVVSEIRRMVEQDKEGKSVNEY